ncbi:bifunctional homocysteine S-methyltransferase/methylenetetrahydrofolate reductase [Geotalea sp. SG265]|uniref:bifunctional homocysteine S-methyltransferase/methylenetetrahydrofolate reductase n=1 Tax=Geotalea sp. SG265 TaxID=2922867 RepID=UPI001FAF3449
MKFLEALQQEVLIGDGATGTMLYAKGISPDANFEHLNLVKPSLVLDLHREYVAAGARVIETNTFGANFPKLDAIGIGGKLRDINVKGAQLARQAAGGADVHVAGSIGPLIGGRGEEKVPGEDEIRRMFAAQVDALAEGGVDLFLLETFSDLRQLEIGVEVAKQTGLPVVANMAFGENSRVAGGFPLETVAGRLAAAGADVIGANCGAGPLEISRTVKLLAGITLLPIAVYPNSGFPEYVNGRYLYRATPDYFAGMAEEMAAAGAVLIGGCCGTTPDHIREIAKRLKGRKPTRRQVQVAAIPAHVGEPRPIAAPGFLSSWGEKMVVTVELDPPRGLDCSTVLTGSRVLKEAGADAINLAENPLARVRMGNIALANLIQREIGIEVIVHITCRDRNLLGLQSDLMGASLLGIRSILAVTGDPASLGEQAGASSVFDLNSFTLIKLLDGLNGGVNALGNPLGSGTGFTIGAAFNPNTARMDVQTGRLAKKVANGACFAQTQPIYDVKRLDEMLEQTAHLNIPILPGVLPLVSERNAEFLHNEVPGIVIPDEIRLRMKGKEKEDGAREGLAIAREFIDAVRGRVGGFYLIPPFGRYGIAAELVRYIKR